MKKLFLASFLLLLIAFNFSFGQTTAMDWTKDDCNGTNHNCFSELDSGNVLLCEYVMTCGTCISAANYLEQIYQDYSVSDPGKVKFYAIDWNTSFTCSSFQSWATNPTQLSCTLFLNGYDEVNYYGGMGMPTIVVLGGADHHVYYRKLGYSYLADDANVRAAIDEALSAVNGINENTTSATSLDAYPNPSTSFTNITYSLQAASTVSFEVLNVIGEKIQTIDLSQQGVGENHFTLNTGMFNSGVYFVNINTGTTKETIKLVVVN
ncbi:MAG TPA: T9SS type A sorting domain-containing protein [Chitinophagales bacterium]|nr:T9SS type A sorting domain-containing protein [Chitinophagales bacterium]